MKDSLTRRIVITGMGVVSPIGNHLAAFKENLMKGVCGEGPITSFDAQDFPVKNAYEVKDFDAHHSGTHLMDPFIQYALTATDEAVRTSGVDLKLIDFFRVGISVSSSKGGVHTIERFKDRFQKRPSAILGARIYTNSIPNFAAQWIARRWELGGPAKCYIAACATGTVAVIEGARMIQEGVVDYCIAGAGDASIVPLLLAGYRNMKTLAKERMRPFDRNRTGFLVGEGAGIVFLETLDSARARGAMIYGEILGSGYGSDGTDALHFSRDGHALEKTIQSTLQTTGLRPEDLGYLNLHGTGTKAGDVYETLQIKRALGNRAYEIPMSSIKSMTGHMLGASGAVEIIASLLAINDQRIPPTIHLDEPDEECDLDYTAGKARQAEVRTALSLSMGFGGHVAVIALGKI